MYFFYIIGSISNSKFAKAEKKIGKWVKIDDLDKNDFLKLIFRI